MWTLYYVTKTRVMSMYQDKISFECTVYEGAKKMHSAEENVMSHNTHLRDTPSGSRHERINRTSSFLACMPLSNSFWCIHRYPWSLPELDSSLLMNKTTVSESEKFLLRKSKGNNILLKCLADIMQPELAKQVNILS